MSVLKVLINLLNEELFPNVKSCYLKIALANFLLF